LSKKIIQLVWTPPPTVENLDAEEFKIKTEDGLVKILNKDGVVRILPQSRVTLIQFMTLEERPRLALPRDLAEAPRGPAQ
jgi:hypothetical protein